MKRRPRAGGKPVKARRGKTVTLKRDLAPKAERPRAFPAASREAEFTRLTRERDEALARQAATLDILRVISQSPTDVRPVFERIVETALRLLRCDMAHFFTCDDATYSPVVGATPQGPLAELGPANLPIDPSANFPSRAMIEQKMLYLPDWSLIDLPEHERHIHATLGLNSALYLPLLREGQCIGLLVLGDKRADAFSAGEIALAESFRDQALIAIENTRLFKETKEALEQQTATSEVLRVISSSPGDLRPVFDAMLENATRLSEAHFGLLLLYQAPECFQVVAMYNVPPAFAELRQREPVFNVGPQTGLGRAAATKKVVHIANYVEETAYKQREPAAVALAELGGARTFLVVPMLKEEQMVGAIAIYRQEIRPFSDKQIELVDNFAAQAIIAIENTRLLNELRESLQQQTATADVLEVISRSAFDLQPVFDTVAESSVRLCGADRAFIRSFDGELLRMVASYNAPKELKDWVEKNPVRPGRHSGSARAALERRTIHIPDVLADPEYSYGAKNIEAIRTILGVPILKGDELLGVIMIYHLEVRPFTDKQIALVETFAGQAAIAIENVRLFDDVQKRTRELTESLEQQTATSEVLKIISSSPGELEPVFQSMLENATRLCQASFGNLLLLEGDGVRIAAMHNAPPAFSALRQRMPVFRPPEWSREPDKPYLHIADCAEEPAYKQRHPGAVAMVELAGARTLLGVPMLKDGILIGYFALYRQEVWPFSDKQIALVTSFAAQAVIAIENARLLNELRQRTTDLTKSLEQQTATSEVLSVISRSKFDLQPILQSVVDTAARLCRAEQATLSRLDGGLYRFAAGYSLNEEYQRIERQAPILPGPGTVVGRAAVSRAVARIDDALTDSLYEKKEDAKIAGIRSMIGVPLMREGEPIGVIALARCRVEPFVEREIELVSTFADQAVIAIENARLFEAEQQRTRELTESLEQQTATSEILASISGSMTDSKPVFKAIVRNLLRLFGTSYAVVQLLQDGMIHMAALDGELGFENLSKQYPRPMDNNTFTGLAVLSKQVIQFASVIDNPAVPPASRKFARDFSYDSMIAAPMLRGDTVIGAVVTARRKSGAFDEKQVALIKAFADQAVIAVENARLLNELRQRTTDLTGSLEDLRSAQDRLVQTEKLASLGQLTAGIAHEIKNPLNFVNNFSAVSVELIDELRETLGGVHLDSKRRTEINEIADTLQGNLDKIVQHGKRADSIVKNMLLHSRQGSVEHRPVDINALVDESLNLAYHGARAEQQGFNITLERSFDPAAGEVDLFPQEITRVLLNLISNGFYAATKRKAEANGGDYEPTLAAATKNLGDSVEISIRDNGTGVPPEVKEKLFNPFFTTKPAGEGTGLGLSISHDIIVKQHGGSIEVDTQLGEFTVFRIILPRKVATIARSGER